MRKFARLIPILVVAVVAVVLFGCSSDSTDPAVPGEARPADSIDKATILADFIVHGDSHAGNDVRNPDVPWVHPALVQQFLAHDPDYLFHVGDVIDNGCTAADPYGEIYHPVWGGVLGSIPTYPSIGNHDDPAEFYGYFTQLNGNGRYYETDEAASCLFIVLDIPTCGEDQNLTAQEAFLFGTLADPDLAHLEHRFVFFHEPPFTTGFRGGCPPAELWDTELRELGVDIVFSGHTHAYEHFVSPEPNIVDPPIERGGGVGGSDPLPPLHYIVTGGAGGYEQYPDDEKHENLVSSRYDPHYIHVHVGARGIIHVFVRDPYGVQLEYYRIYD